MNNELPFEAELERAFDQTYQSIAHDLVGDNNTICRDDLFDISLDFIEMYGDLEGEALQWWREMDLELKIEYKTTVLTDENYEVLGAEWA